MQLPYLLAGGFVFYYFHIIKAYSVAKLIKAFFCCYHAHLGAFFKASVFSAFKILKIV